MAAVLSPQPHRMGLPKRRVPVRRTEGQPVVSKTPIVFTTAKGPKRFSSQEDRSTGSTRPTRSKRSRKVDTSDEDHRAPRKKPRLSSTIFQRSFEDIDPPATIPNSTLLEHIATSRFFHHYVSPTRTFYRLDLDFVSSVIDDASQRSILAEVIIALGILTLPIKTDASCTAARLQYSRALKMTNQALQDETVVKRDEVIMAVILLSLFETTPDDAHSLATWTAHLDGARSLLRLRGRKLLESGPAYRMFAMLRQQVLVNSVVTMNPAPQDVIDMSEQIAETQNEDEKHACDVAVLYARMCNLIASSRHPGKVDPCLFLADALTLDNDLESWASLLPSSYNYRSEPSAQSYTGFCDIYYSLFHAEVLNIYRMARISVNGIIFGQQAMLEAERSFTETQVTDLHNGLNLSSDPMAAVDMGLRLATIETLRMEVCASIPFQLGCYGQQVLRRTVDIPLGTRTPVTQYLLAVTKTPGISDDMHAWAMAQVAELQSEREVDNGAIFAKTLTL